MEESDVSQIKTEQEDPEFIAIKVEPWTCTSQEEHNGALETKCGFCNAMTPDILMHIDAHRKEICAIVCIWPLRPLRICQKCAKILLAKIMI